MNAVAEIVVAGVVAVRLVLGVVAALLLFLLLLLLLLLLLPLSQGVIVCFSAL